MRRSLIRTLAFVVAALLIAACAQPADPGRDLANDRGLDSPHQQGPLTSDDSDTVIDAALADVEDFWVEYYPAVYGRDYAPVKGFYPYGPGTEVPPCGFPPLTYDVIADNAFYCESDDLIAWDVTLMDTLNDQFGSFTLGIVMAHEFAHAVQARVPVAGRTVDLELQADCYAGAWTGDVAEGNSAAFTVDSGVLDASVAGMLAISDAPGTDANDPTAHGSGFDRITAFQDGFENGPHQCGAYDEAPRQTVEIPFTADDFENEDPGNMPLEDRGPDPMDRGLLTLAEIELNEFFNWVLGDVGAVWEPVLGLAVVDPRVDQVTCGGQALAGGDLEFAAVYCANENTIVIDGAGLVPALNEIGDFAVAAELARLWAFAAQTQLGIGESLEANLQADCLTGAWAATLFDAEDKPYGLPIEDVPLQISAGDLDEAIMGFLAYPIPSEAGGGTVFDRTTALRTGVLQGFPACEGYTPLG